MKVFIYISVFLFSGLTCVAQSHPNLTITASGVKEIKAHLDRVTLFQNSLESAKEEVEVLLAEGVLVPVPRDLAGGYSHEVHKRNFLLLQKAGAIYQITGEEKYAKYIRDVFMAYAEMYPTLDKHPSERSYARGKIFWQCLNDANWMVYMSQAYDCIYNYLSKNDRNYLEKNLFKPFADYISVENPQFFNRIHNHSTWGNAAVGLMALVMGDEELLHRALYGLETEINDPERVDDDGGLISLPGQNKAGFYAQLDHAFSPDGYYTEGPYYQRYAMTPFILFAQALNNHKPELKIFAYRDSLLPKAVFAILNQTDSKGAFYPINDAQKGMSYHSRELISAVDVIYYLTRDASLLSISKEQGIFQLDQAGFSAAKGIMEGLAVPFQKQPVELRDGANGDEGAIGVLRSYKNGREISVLFKYAAQGMGHGHFDRLSYSVYDGSTEVLQDYGSARWVNIDQKSGGGYLKENQTWAKQTLAHNTLVIDQESQFDGNTNKANPFHGAPYFFNAENSNVQIVSAKETHAYKDIELQRTLCLLTDEAFEKPLLIDVLRVQADDGHQLDLPFHFQTQLMATNFDYQTTSPEVMGESHGYQHVWKEAEGTPAEDNVRITWFSNHTFYELTTLADLEDDLVFGRIGANDPAFNLRRDAFFMLRKKEQKDALFVSLVRSHGSYDPVSEIPVNPYPPKLHIKVLINTREYSIIQVKHPESGAFILKIANQQNGKAVKHRQEIDGRTYEWKGPVELSKEN